MNPLFSGIALWCGLVVAPCVSYPPSNIHTEFRLWSKGVCQHRWHAAMFKGRVPLTNTLTAYPVHKPKYTMVKVPSTQDQHRVSCLPKLFHTTVSVSQCINAEVPIFRCCLIPQPQQYQKIPSTRYHPGITRVCLFRLECCLFVGRGRTN